MTENPPQEGRDRERDDETGPVADPTERPKQQGNAARGKPNEHKTLRPARGRQKAETWKGNRTDVGEARTHDR
jgi:hypothetical protein